jgi:hypothetical protein
VSRHRWRHISTLKDDEAQGVRDILVWNPCNGPYFIRYTSDDWFHLFATEGRGWDMWRAVVPPTEDEIAVAKRVAERWANRPIDLMSPEEMAKATHLWRIP